MGVLAAAFVAGAAPAPITDPVWAVSPAPEHTALTYAGTTPAHCADGWASPSISRRGACSHHGGVVAGIPLWESEVVPAVAGVMEEEPHTDNSVRALRVGAVLLVGSLGGWWVWRRKKAPRQH